MIPPKLALWGSLIFILWVFRRDARENSYPSRALWLPSLWMMRCGSRSLNYWGLGNFPWDQVFVAAFIVFGLIVLARRPCAWGQIFAHNFPIFLFYGYLFLSLTWVSEFQDPVIKAARPLGDLVMALVVATERDPKAAVVTILRRTGIALIPLSIVLIRYFPDLGRLEDKHWGSDLWIGVTTHKNPLGQLCLASALGFFWTMIEARKRGVPLKKQRLFWLYAALIYYPMFYADANSRSSTSILCLIVAVGLFLIFGYLRTKIQAILRTIVLGAAAVGLLALVLQFFGGSLQGVVAGFFGKNDTLSDRTYLWADVERLGMQHPILGTGYGGFWVPSIFAKLSPEVNNRPEEAHSGYLETFANLGLVGVGLLAIVIVQSVRSAARTAQMDFEYGRVRLALLFTVLVMNYAEATFPRGTHLWWFGFLIVALFARDWVYWPEQTVSVSEEPIRVVSESEPAMP